MKTELCMVCRKGELEDEKMEMWYSVKYVLIGFMRSVYL